MSVDYYLACFTCEQSVHFATGSGFRGFRINRDSLDWLGDGEAVGHHEGHDLRILGRDAEPPWECCGIRKEVGMPCPICEPDDEQEGNENGRR